MLPICPPPWTAHSGQQPEPATRNVRFAKSKHLRRTIAMRRSSRIMVAVSTVVMFALAAMAQEAPAGNTGRALPVPTSAPTPQAGHVYVPESSKARPEDVGLRSHTTYVLHSVDGNKPAGLKIPTAEVLAGPAATILMSETPQSLGCIYVTIPNSAPSIPNSPSASAPPIPP